MHPGGCAAHYQKEGYSFAVGATVAMGLEPGGLVRKIYEQLDLSPNYVEVNPALRVHLDDRRISVEKTREAWFTELASKFPGQEKEKQAFWREAMNLAAAMYYASKRFPVLPFKRFADMTDTLKAFHPKLLTLVPHLSRTVKDRLEHYGIDDPAHKAFIDGQLLDAMQTTSDHCVMTSGALALDIYRYGCQYKIGGLSTIAEDLAAYVTANGGEVAYATRVKQIFQDKHQVKGVATNRGDVYAPVIVSAIPLSNTAELLQPSQTNLAVRAQKQAPMWGAFTLYMGIDENCLPEDSHYYEQVTEVGHYHDGGNLLMSISPAWDRSRAPEGKRAVTVSTHVDAQQWLELSKDKAAYRQAKTQMEEALLSRIERVFPGLRGSIEYFRSGTPKTFQNFTLRAGGTVGGFPQTVSFANFNAPSHHSSVKGLFLAGDTVFPGQGVLGVTVSGHNAARSASRYLTKAINRSSHAKRLDPPLKEANYVG